MEVGIGKSASSSLTCFLLPECAPSRKSPLFAYVSSPAPAAIHGAEVGGAAQIFVVGSVEKWESLELFLS